MPVLIEKGYVILTEKKGMLSNAKYALTEEGIRVKDRINDLFIDSDNLLNWMDSNPEKAKAFLSAVGTHIFILPYDRGQLQLLKKIDWPMLKPKHQNSTLTCCIPFLWGWE
nr:hypothetical protein [Methanobacterium formicicum]